MAATDATPQTARTISTDQVDMPWREYIGQGHGSTQDMAFVPKNSHASFVMDVPWTQLEQAIAFIIGWSIPGGGGSLRRYLPMSHPTIPFFWARGVVKVDPIKWKSLNAAFIDRGAAGFFNTSASVYAAARLTVDFWQPTFLIAIDGVVAEWVRYVDPMIEPDAKFITRDRGDAIFNDGPRSGQSIGTKGSQNIYLPGERMAFKWMQLPQRGMFPNLQQGDWSSPNLDACVGKVNSVAFMGKPAGTLLMEPYKIEIDPWPVNITRLNMFAGISTPTLYNFLVSMKFFDPPAGVTAANQHPGHLGVPNAGAGGDNLYYTWQTGGNYVYKSTDFANAFKLNA